MIIQSLYYPGAGHDFDVLEHFSSKYGTQHFFYCDYLPSMALVPNILTQLKGWNVLEIVALQPSDFGASNWDEFWFEKKRSYQPQLPDSVEPFGNTLTLEHPKGFQCKLTYLCTEGVGSIGPIARTFGMPDCMVLQDHGFGGNWTTFGGDSELFSLARDLGLPPFIFHGENTSAWDGYESVTEFEGSFGMHEFRRSLKQQLK